MSSVSSTSESSRAKMSRDDLVTGVEDLTVRKLDPVEFEAFYEKVLNPWIDQIDELKKGQPFLQV